MTSKEYKLFLERLLKITIRREKAFSIIIQGPLHERMRESIPIYLDIVKQYQYFTPKLKNNPYSSEHTSGNLILSYWEGDDESIIKEYKNNKDIVLLKNIYSNLPKVKRVVASRGSAPWIYQNYSCLQAINKSTGHLCLKTRSDELYPNLISFCKYMIDLNESLSSMPIVTSDIYARKDSVNKFHPSDHIIGSTNFNMKNGFSHSYNCCKSSNYLQSKFPEQLICKSFLHSLGVEIKDYKSAEIMKKYFRIFPIQKMPKSIWTCSYRKYQPLTGNEPGWIHDIQDI
mgnify:CR=1 FL=1|tara:strand:- start:16388 stop:17245 length:858 start_codon:yes stop_codon:yes gene_type:complete